MLLSNTVFVIAELFGTVAFAVSGAMVAIEKRLDLFGVLFLGAITACGGGILRDLLVGQIPPISLIHPQNLAIATGTALGVFLIARGVKSWYLNSTAMVKLIFNILDAVGLGMFTITGSQTAIAAGYADNALLVVSMGVITGIGGGLIRDMIIHELPSVLTRHIYAVASIAGGLLFYALSHAAVDSVCAMLWGVAVVFVIRMLATAFKWNLPKAIQ